MWVRLPSWRGEDTFQLIEGAVPAFPVTAAALVIVQPGMGDGQFRAFGDGAKIELDQGLTGIFHPAKPAPAHGETLGPCDLDILAVAFMFAAVELAEAHPEKAANPQVGLGQENRTGVGTPPTAHSLRRGQRVKDNRRPRGDPANNGKAGHPS